MDCVKNWSKTCLSKEDQDKLAGSASGALDTYKFLCSDKKFQKDYLEHADCYTRISPHWDKCAHMFIESLKRIDHPKDIRSVCCTRYTFLQCIAQATSTLCSKNATKFIQRLAESLVRTNIRSNQLLSKCTNVGQHNCSTTSSGQSSTKLFSTSISTFIPTILYYPTKGLINSLNVLQNLAFSDITTFFCALSREFSPYFSHHRIALVEVASSSTFSSISANNTATLDANNTWPGDLEM